MNVIENVIPYRISTIVDLRDQFYTVAAGSWTTNA